MPIFPLLLLCQQAASAPQVVSLASLDLAAVEQEWGAPQANQSVEKHALTIGGRKFDSGLGTHASGQFAVQLGGAASSFHAFVGADDETLPKQGSIAFRVLGDGKELWKSGLMRTGERGQGVPRGARGREDAALARR